MCQMCEDYEAELRRLGIAPTREIAVTPDDGEMDSIRRRAAANGHKVETEIIHVLREALRPLKPDRAKAE